MSSIPIKDAADATRKVDVFTRTEGADTVEMQAVVPVDPATGNALSLATETTLAALLQAANAIQAAAEALNGKATAINTGAVAGTVALDAPTLAALETTTVGGSVAVSNFPGTQSVSGTIALDAPTLAALETITVGGSVTVSNFPGTVGTGLDQPLTDAQLRASALALPTGAATEATLGTLGTTLSSATKQKNSAATVTDYGRVMLAQRRDADTAETTGDGQYTTLKQDEAGRLKVSTQPGASAATAASITANSQTIPINVERSSNVTISMVATTLVGHNATFEYSNNSTNGADGNWYQVQAVRSNANTVEVATGVLAATPVYGWEASVNAYKWFRVRATAHTSGTAAYILLPGAYATEPIPAVQVTATQPISGAVTVTAGTVNPVVPATPYIVNSLATTNGALILTGTSGLQAFYATNTGAAVAFVKLYNKATAPTVGTDVPAMILPVPAAVAGVPGVCTLPIGFSGFRFALGLGVAITGLVADTDTTAVAAGQVKVILSRTI